MTRDERIKMHLVECVAAGIPVRDGRIQKHPYQPDPQSGSGNCVCARHDGHTIHQEQGNNQ